MQLVVFSLGRDRYALPVERVREVIRHRTPTAGVIDLCGSLVPVRDIAERVAAAARAGAAPRIVMLRCIAWVDGVLVPCSTPSACSPASCPAAWAAASRAPRSPRPLARAKAKPKPAAADRRAGPKPAAKPKAQPSRKRSESATRSTGGADTGSPSSVTE